MNTTKTLSDFSVKLLNTDRYDYRFEGRLYALSSNEAKALVEYLSNKLILNETEKEVLSYCEWLLEPGGYDPDLEDERNHYEDPADYYDDESRDEEDDKYY